MNIYGVVVCVQLVPNVLLRHTVSRCQKRIFVYQSGSHPGPMIGNIATDIYSLA